MSRTPSRSFTLIAFGAAGCVSLATFSQVTCAEAAPVLPLWVPCDLVPRCLTFSEEMRVGSGGNASLHPLPLEVTFSIMCSDAGGSRMARRAGLDAMFPWSSVALWVLCVGLPPWSGPPCAPLVGEEG